MDVLSEVLKVVKLDGAVFFNGEFSSPWCVREPDACAMASYLSARSAHVIIFHLVTEGRGYARIEDAGRPVSFSAGDILAAKPTFQKDTGYFFICGESGDQRVA